MYIYTTNYKSYMSHPNSSTSTPTNIPSCQPHRKSVSKVRQRTTSTYHPPAGIPEAWAEPWRNKEYAMMINRNEQMLEWHAWGGRLKNLAVAQRAVSCLVGDVLNNMALLDPMCVETHGIHYLSTGALIVASNCWARFVVQSWRLCKQRQFFIWCFLKILDPKSCNIHHLE